MRGEPQGMKVSDLLLEARFDHQKYDDADSWAEDFAQELGSAFEMWMNSDQKEALWHLAKDGKKIKAKTFTICSKHDDDAKHDRDLERMDKHIKNQELKGFEVFGQEENDDVCDVIFYQK
jgi:hypothetical protein